jgi:hypothetical protein
MPYSNHATWVDMDGNGTMGVLASRWQLRESGQNQWRSFDQYLLWMYDGEVITAFFGHMRAGVSAYNRLVLMDSTGACNMTRYSYYLSNVGEGLRYYVSGVAYMQFWSLGWMLGCEEDPDYFHVEGYDYFTHIYYRPSESAHFSYRQRERTLISYEELNDLMQAYGLHDMTRDVWELPDETQVILAMLTE